MAAFYLDVDFAPAGRPDRLYRNEIRNADEPRARFTDVTVESGLGDEYGAGHAALWWDFNRDGNPDLFVANEDGSQDRHYMNNGDGTFIDLAAADFPVLPVGSQGVAGADIDGNGWPDLFIGERQALTREGRLLRAEALRPDTADAPAGDRLPLDPGPPLSPSPSTLPSLSLPDRPTALRNVLLCGFGGGRFIECARQAGVAATGWSWGVVLQDFDNDGMTDLFVANGMAVDIAAAELESGAGDPARLRMTDWDRYTRNGITPLEEPDLFHRNAGDFRFEDVTDRWLGRHPSVSLAAVSADLDRDGDLDLVVVHLDRPPSILLNRTTEGNSFLVRLQGSESSPAGIGATVRLEIDGAVRSFFVSPSGGFLGSPEPVVVCGLGSRTRADRMTIEWPSGRSQEIRDVLAHRLYTIREPASRRKDPPAKPLAPLPQDDPLLVESFGARDAVHRERAFDDFSAQPLLPHQLSRLGPGIAVGDVDGDGREDFVLGGAAGQATTVHRNVGAGAFEPCRQESALAGAAESEDMGMVLFEADGDGDLDLYVVSGGAEHRFGDPALLDRLYLNDGKGIFSAAPFENLPVAPESGSCVAAADFDRDGDLDLFVGGRVTPGKYPLAPANRLLVNDGTGAFIDATADLAPDLAFTGMTTAALWTDWNTDGWIDLVIAHEWGPILFFANEKGRLRNATPSTPGSAPATGCWLSLATADVDGDGDPDLFAGNLGLNTPYQASQDSPAVLLAGDFGEGGVLHLLEAMQDESGSLFPRRNRREIAAGISGLGGRLGTARDFAAATLEELVPADLLVAAERLNLRETRSGLFLNENGGARWRFVPAPGFAQLAPVRAAVFTAFDFDAAAAHPHAPDLVIAQNWMSTRPGDEPFGGGGSAVLKGLGDGSFSAVSPDASGLFVNGDAAALALIDAGTDQADSLLFAINDEPVRLFRRNPGPTRVPMPAPTPVPPLEIRLEGTPGNPASLGASVTVEFADGRTVFHEVPGGGGGLAQSPARIRIADTRTTDPPKRIRVRWPDGTEAEYPAEAAESPEPNRILLRRPNPTAGE